jgi:hypothetical protein
VRYGNWYSEVDKFLISTETYKPARLKFSYKEPAEKHGNPAKILRESCQIRKIERFGGYFSRQKNGKVTEAGEIGS